MERNKLRRAWEKFFADRFVPDLEKPTHCVKTNELDEFAELAKDLLSIKDANKLKRLLNKLRRATWEELEKKDKAFLREVRQEQTVGDRQRAMLNNYLVPHGGRMGLIAEGLWELGPSPEVQASFNGEEARDYAEKVWWMLENRRPI